jgi:DNA invertase Pin-like site-specific DNA recombinase
MTQRENERMNPRTAVYVRVSSPNQNTAGQEREIQQWLAGNAIENAEWYVDRVTGDNLDRPAFQKLQADIFHGKVKTVVVWKLDRLSRNLRDGINVLADWCDRGLRVVSITQQIDFNGAVGKMLAAVLLGVAEMETETRRERQAAGIAAAKERGVYSGRLVGTTAASPTRAAELHRQGLADSEIANALDVSTRTVQRYLRANKSSPNG